MTKMPFPLLVVAAVAGTDSKSWPTRETFIAKDFSEESWERCGAVGDKNPGCKFPFEYQGIRYNSCASLFYKDEANPWCVTKHAEIKAPCDVTEITTSYATIYLPFDAWNSWTQCDKKGGNPLDGQACVSDPVYYDGETRTGCTTLWEEWDEERQEIVDAWWCATKVYAAQMAVGSTESITSGHAEGSSTQTSSTETGSDDSKSWCKGQTFIAKDITEESWGRCEAAGEKNPGCKFPFEYQGIRYNSCASLFYDGEAAPWCVTKHAEIKVPCDVTEITTSYATIYLPFSDPSWAQCDEEGGNPKDDPKPCVSDPYYYKGETRTGCASQWDDAWWCPTKVYEAKMAVGSAASVTSGDAGGSSTPSCSTETGSDGASTLRNLQIPMLV